MHHLFHLDTKAEDHDEVDSGRPRSRQSHDLGQSRRGRQISITLDKFTGDSLLHFSYSAVGGGAGGGMHPDTLGEQSPNNLSCHIIIIVACTFIHFVVLV